MATWAFWRSRRRLEGDVTMCEEWMSMLTLPLTADQFRQLPQNSAYRYDYLRGTAILSPRPRHFHGTLELGSWHPPEPERPRNEVTIRRARLEDQETLAQLFAVAFERTQPFAGLVSERRLEGARTALQRTFQDGDGPWLSEASFVALHSDKETALGAILITLVPGGDPAESENFRWNEPPPADVRERRTAQPHLTWIFVSPIWKACGMGTLLLDRAIAVLKDLGYRSLWTTFLLGNDASTLWHWRNGFILAQNPLSRRRVKTAP